MTATRPERLVLLEVLTEQELAGRIQVALEHEFTLGDPRCLGCRAKDALDELLWRLDCARDLNP